jgi:hypothetical protein
VIYGSLLFIDCQNLF